VGEELGKRLVILGKKGKVDGLVIHEEKRENEGAKEREGPYQSIGQSKCGGEKRSTHIWQGESEGCRTKPDPIGGQ